MSDRVDTLPSVVMCVKCEYMAGAAANARAATPVPSWGSSAYHGQLDTVSSNPSSSVLIFPDQKGRAVHRIMPAGGPSTSFLGARRPRP
jgi:hypothetical protein